MMTRTLAWLLLAFIHQQLMSQDCVQDTLPPTLNCIVGVASFPLQKGKEKITVQAKDLVRSAIDNCSPENEVSISFDSISLAPLISLTCEDVGLNVLTIYAWDKNNQRTQCTVQLSLRDPQFNCSTPSSFELVGTFITTRNDDEFPEFSFEWVDSNDVVTAFEPVDIQMVGDQFSIDLYEGDQSPFPPKSRVVVKLKGPEGNYDYGVSTLDVVFVIKHILGIQPFTDERQWYAADTNGDGRVTTLDVVELRKLILGITDAFPRGESYIYFPSQWEIASDELPQSIVQEFSLIKLGDVNIY